MKFDINILIFFHVFFSILKEKVEALGAAGCKVEISEEPLCITLLTPLMQRQLLSQDSCSAFIDSSASCDAANSSLTMVLVATKAGAVPIGACIHSSQNEESYLRVFSMLCKQLNTLNPSMHIENFMTDDSDAMRNALHSVFPSVPLLLCQFHVLQAVWRWLFNKRNNIDQKHRKFLITLFKNIMYAKCKKDAESKVNAFIDNDIVKIYPKYLSYIENYFKRRNEWCLAYRVHIRNMQHNTNNYAEATFRIIKDVILTRLKAYNSISLIEYIANIMDPYYVKRLLDVIYCRQKKPYLMFDKYRNKAEKLLSISSIEQFQGYYLVQSDTDKKIFYEVDIGLCSCIDAMQGAFCKHQCAVLLKFKLEFPNAPSLSPTEKETMFRVAVGSSCTIPNFLIGIMGETHADKSEISKETDAEMNEPESLIDNNSNFSNCKGASNTLQECNDYTPKPIGESETKILNDFNSEFLRIEKMIGENLTDKYLMEHTKKFVQKFQQINTPMQLSNFFVQCMKNTKSIHKRKIKVQPTSISRRKNSTSRGSLRQRSGRPREGEKISNKRKHSLGKNIEMGQRNA